MKKLMTGAAMVALITAAPTLAAGERWQLAQAEKQVEQSQEMTATTACPEGATETADGESCPPDTAAAPADEAATDEMDAAETEVMPEEDDAAAMSTPEEESVTTGSLPDAESETGVAEEDTTEMAATDGEKFIAEQDETAVLSSELVGQTVYNPADEVLGDVNDMIWTEDGQVKGIIIGVGGFLGIGEKDVAVAYDAVNITTDENGDHKLILDATEDELAAAPEFLTVDEQLALMRQEQAAPAAGDGATGLAPVEPAPAPAE
jgi:sporulation protein YlmC with PRC-barrel domain